MRQGAAAVGGYSGGEDDHPFPLAATLVQIRPDAGLRRHTGGISISGHFHPLGHDLLGALLQIAVGLGEYRRLGEYGVGHALVVLLGVGEAALLQKSNVHLPPNAVGVDEGSIHVKNQPIFFLSSQNRQGKSTASSA